MLAQLTLLVALAQLMALAQQRMKHHPPHDRPPHDRLLQVLAQLVVLAQLTLPVAMAQQHLHVNPPCWRATAHALSVVAPVLGAASLAWLAWLLVDLLHSLWSVVRSAWEWLPRERLLLQPGVWVEGPCGVEGPSWLLLHPGIWVEGPSWLAAAAVAPQPGHTTADATTKPWSG